MKIQCDLDWKILCLPCRTQVKWRSNGAAKNPKGTTKSGRFLWGFPNPKPLNPGKVRRINAERWNLTSFFRIFGVFAGLVESFVFFSASWLSHRNLGAWGFPLVVILQRSVCVYAFFQIYTMYSRKKYQFRLIKADLLGGTLEANPQISPFDHSKREVLRCFLMWGCFAKCLDLSAFTSCFDSDKPCFDKPLSLMANANDLSLRISHPTKNKRTPYCLNHLMLYLDVFSALEF